MFFTNSLSSYRNDNFQITKPLTTNSPKQKINKIKTKKKKEKIKCWESDVRSRLQPERVTESSRDLR